MFNEIDLRALAERQGPERAFLSLYLSGPQALSALDQRIATVRRLLADDEVELEYFEENLQIVRRYVDENASGGARCVFACWATDYVEGFALEAEVPDLLWVDSSPYIRPLAELQDVLLLPVLARHAVDAAVHGEIDLRHQPPSSCTRGGSPGCTRTAA